MGHRRACCGVGEGVEWESGGGRHGLLQSCSSLLDVAAVVLERNRHIFQDVECLLHG